MEPDETGYNTGELQTEKRIVRRKVWARTFSIYGSLCFLPFALATWFLACQYFERTFFRSLLTDTELIHSETLTSLAWFFIGIEILLIRGAVVLWVVEPSREVMLVDAFYRERLDDIDRAATTSGDEA